MVTPERQRRLVPPLPPIPCSVHLSYLAVSELHLYNKLVTPCQCFPELCDLGRGELQPGTCDWCLKWGRLVGQSPSPGGLC